jgi:protein SCO1
VISVIKNRHNLIATIIVLLFGFILFFVGTDGFSAFTAETARVNQLIEEKPKFPKVTLEDSKGETYPFTEFENKYVLITFMYTSCKTVCLELENNMAQVYDLMPKKYIGKEINFLSISFDPERDDPATLDTYKNYFRSDGDTWRMARISDQTELNSLLKKFGVIVIPDENGNFAHNSAFYLVDKKGHLVEVMDFKKIDEAADKIIKILDKEVGE